MQASRVRKVPPTSAGRVSGAPTRRVKVCQRPLAHAALRLRLCDTCTGAATFIASLGCICASIVSVILRADWSLPGVQGTYLTFEGGGDQVW